MNSGESAMRRQRLSGLVVVSWAGSLSAAPPPKGDAAKDLYHPVTVGTTWVYDESDHDTTIVLSKVEAAEKGTLVTCDFISAAGTRTPCHKIRVSADGLWMTEKVGEEYEPALQLLKAPFKSNDKWEVATRRGAVRVTGTFTLAAEEEVTVPAGKFKAVKVIRSDFKIGARPGPAEAVWYATGVGKVKREDDADKPIRTLKKITPGKD
jgi:hypothetical protein